MVKTNKSKIAHCKKRKVYGTDLVVAYRGKKDNITVQEITSKEGDNGRYTSSGLLKAMGYNDEKEEVCLFIKNNNLNYAGNGLRGVLMLVNHRIGLVIKSVGTFILFQVLLPRRLAGSFEILDLCYKNRQYGFYLQQVRGERPARLNYEHRMREKVHGYPYAKNTHVYMNPLGPDFFVTEYAKNIPSELWRKFSSLTDNLCAKNYEEASSQVQFLRKSSVTTVVYLREDPIRMSLERMADKYFIPCGDPHGERLSPWPTRDGSYGR